MGKIFTGCRVLHVHVQEVNKVMNEVIERFLPFIAGLRDESIYIYMYEFLTLNITDERSFSLQTL